MAALQCVREGSSQWQGDVICSLAVFYGLSIVRARTMAKIHQSHRAGAGLPAYRGPHEVFYVLIELCADGCSILYNAMTALCDFIQYIYISELMSSHRAPLMWSASL